MSTPQTARQITEQERRKEITSAHEDRMASFRKSEEAARLRREEAADVNTVAPVSTASSEAIADLENIKPISKTPRTKK